MAADYEFDVQKVPVYQVVNGQPQEIEGYIGVQRPDNNTILAIMSDKYKIVLNKVVVDAFEEALRQKSLTASKNFWMEWNTARLFVEYGLQEVVTIGGIEVHPNMVLINSYDGSYTETLHVLCKHPDLQFFPIGQKRKTFIKRKHVGAAEVDFLRMLTEGLELWSRAIVELKKWENIGVTVDEAKLIVAGSSFKQSAQAQTIADFNALPDKTLFGLFEKFEKAIHDTVRHKSDYDMILDAQLGMDEVIRAATEINLLHK